MCMPACVDKMCYNWFTLSKVQSTSVHKKAYIHRHMCRVHDMILIPYHQPVANFSYIANPLTPRLKSWWRGSETLGEEHHTDGWEEQNVKIWVNRVAFQTCSMSIHPLCTNKKPTAWPARPRKQATPRQFRFQKRLGDCSSPQTYTLRAAKLRK